jgi:ankyrin repeat protein
MNSWYKFAIKTQIKMVAVLSFLCVVNPLFQWDVMAQNSDHRNMDIERDPRNRLSSWDHLESNSKSIEDLEKLLKFTGPKLKSKNSFQDDDEKVGVLIGAIGNDDTLLAQEIIQTGTDVNSRINKGGLTPLMISRSAKMTKTLLSLGADPNLKDLKGMTALHHMIFTDGAETILPILINAGVDVHSPAAGSGNETPLLVARQLFFKGGDLEHGKRIVRILLEAGASVNDQDDLGYTFFITAAVNNKFEMAKFILKMGADPQIRTIEGITALDWVRESHHMEIEKILLENGKGL